MELSTYFRINAADTGQFERTLIIADEGAYVSYLEGCTAPMRDDEPAARRGRRARRARRRDDQVLDRAELVPRRQGRQGRHLQLRHQARQVPRARSSKISWTQVETGSAITWKYPSVHPAGRRLRRRVLLGRAHEQPPAGRHRHEDDPHRQEHEVDDRLEGHLRRPRPEHLPRPGEGRRRAPTGARNYTQCDSLLLGDKCGAHTFPYIEVKNATARGRARGVDVEDRRGPALLLQAARASRPRTRCR